MLELHPCSAAVRPWQPGAAIPFITARQVSDDTGSVALMGSLPSADWLFNHLGDDADRFREALADKGIKTLHLRTKAAHEAPRIRQPPILTAQ